MRKIWLDESGDLGFDFRKQGTSKYFVVTILETSVDESVLKKVVKDCKDRSIRKGKKKKGSLGEIKGSGSTHRTKELLIRYMLKKDPLMKVKSIVIDKKNIEPHLRDYKRGCYNWVVGEILKDSEGDVDLVVDKIHKKRAFIEEFDGYIRNKNPNRFKIKHAFSNSEAGLQIADVFCHSIFQAFEYGEKHYLNLFKDRTKIKEYFFTNRN